ncbi:CDP-diacylglycerol--glycerol-3-phosphate 3-phosphatidyltransferase [Candidatus Saccharibacteria bacterium]|nr:CDP-diacylglycerol--glycerol-3-phosphate 3-phosphatidyltransferase [Candidatus Saccharibacteria bacterium]
MSKKTITGPTWLTILRILLAILFMIFILYPASWAVVTAFIIFIVASVTDKIDGHWARKTNNVTDLGAFLDPLADKILVNLALLALVYLQVVPVWVFAIILVRDFTIDGMRMSAARKNITISASFFGKLKTTFQMIAILILLLSSIVNLEWIKITGDVLLYIALALTVFSGLDYLKKGRKLLIK